MKQLVSRAPELVAFERRSAGITQKAAASNRHAIGMARWQRLRAFCALSWPCPEAGPRIAQRPSTLLTSR